MPTTLSAEEWAKRYGDGGQPATTKQPITLSAEDFAKRYPTQGTGSVQRFFQGAGVPTNEKEVQAAADNGDPFRHPIDLALGPLPRQAFNTLKGIASESGTQSGEALDALQHDEIGDYLKHSAGAAIPYVGPKAAEGDYAGALGRLVAVALPALIGGRGKAPEAISEPTPTPEPIAPSPAPAVNPAPRSNFGRPPAAVRRLQEEAARPVEPPEPEPPTPDPSPSPSPFGKTAKAVMKLGSMVPGPIGTAFKIANKLASAKEVAGFVRDVVNSDQFKNADPSMINGMIQSMRNRDLASVGRFGGAIMLGTSVDDFDQQLKQVNTQNPTPAEDDPRKTSSLANLAINETEFANNDAEYENTPLVRNTSIVDLMPPRFKPLIEKIHGMSLADRNVNYGKLKSGTEYIGLYSRDSSHVPDSDTNVKMPGFKDGLTLSKRDYAIPGRGTQSIVMIDPEAPEGGFPGDFEHTELHEYGHAIWYNTLRPEEKQAWAQIHGKYMAKYDKLKSASKFKDNEAYVPKGIPYGIPRYADDPSHSFSPLFAMYVLAPSAMKSNYPDVYKFFSRVFEGQEYIQKK